jgi:hypothetical protein
MNRSQDYQGELVAKFHRRRTIVPMGGKGRDRTVYRKPDGWAEKRNDAGRAGGIYKTQGEAIEAAKQTLHKQGGGELIVMGRDGRIRSKDTITPGRDPYPPRDREH